MKRIFRYGIDAPPVVASLTTLSLVCFYTAIFDLPSWTHLRVTGTIWPALAFGTTAIVMLWESAYGKRREREHLLDLLTWSGSEKVLDVGCGLGLMATAAAKRVPCGRVDCVDIWRRRDLSGNDASTLMRNAYAEGVAALIHPHTADMRELPFIDASFDRIVSRYAIHNVSDEVSRAKAVQEISRVLAPKGQIVISDIKYIPAYAQQLIACGLAVRTERGPLDFAWALCSFGTIRPSRLVATRL